MSKFKKEWWDERAAANQEASGKSNFPARMNAAIERGHKEFDQLRPEIIKRGLKDLAVLAEHSRQVAANIEAFLYADLPNFILERKAALVPLDVRDINLLRQFISSVEELQIKQNLSLTDVLKIKRTLGNSRVLALVGPALNPDLAGTDELVLSNDPNIDAIAKLIVTAKGPAEIEHLLADGGKLRALIEGISNNEKQVETIKPRIIDLRRIVCSIPALGGLAALLAACGPMQESAMPTPVVQETVVESTPESEAGEEEQEVKEYQYTPISVGGMILPPLATGVPENQLEDVLNQERIMVELIEEYQWLPNTEITPILPKGELKFLIQSGGTVNGEFSEGDVLTLEEGSLVVEKLEKGSEEGEVVGIPATTKKIELINQQLNQADIEAKIRVIFPENKTVPVLILDLTEEEIELGTIVVEIDQESLQINGEIFPVESLEFSNGELRVGDEVVYVLEEDEVHQYEAVAVSEVFNFHEDPSKYQIVFNGESSEGEKVKIYSKHTAGVPEFGYYPKEDPETNRPDILTEKIFDWFTRIATHPEDGHPDGTFYAVDAASLKEEIEQVANQGGGIRLGDERGVDSSRHFGEFNISEIKEIVVVVNELPPLSEVRGRPPVEKHIVPVVMPENNNELYTNLPFNPTGSDRFYSMTNVFMFADQNGELTLLVMVNRGKTTPHPDLDEEHVTQSSIYMMLLQIIRASRLGSMKPSEREQNARRVTVTISTDYTRKLTDEILSFLLRLYADGEPLQILPTK